MKKQNPSDDDTDILVTLDMDDGSQVECEILTIFDMGEQDYIVLLPLDSQGNENQEGIIYIYRYFEDKEGNPSLENIISDEEYEAVEERFEQLLEEANQSFFPASYKNLESSASWLLIFFTEYKNNSCFARVTAT